MTDGAPHPSGSAVDLLIDDVALVSPGEPVRRGWSVAITGREIVAVAPRDSVADTPARRRIDGRGGLCAPGLINTHNHTPIMSVRGMVEDLGFAPAYTPGVPQGHWLGDEETFALARLGLAELLCQGCTTVVDFYNRPDPLARAMAESGLRGFVGGRIMDVDTAALANGRFETRPDLGEATLADNLDVIARWDGRADGRLRCVLGPHAVDTCSPELMRRVADLANSDGRIVHTHLAQSKIEVERVQTRYGKRSSDILDEVGLLNDRLIAAHCIHLDADEIKRIAESGTFVAHAPTGNATGGEIAPIVDLMEAGARITLCTDSKSGDMFETMRAAIKVARIRAEGRFVLNAATVLEWATVGGAAALGMDGRLGRIAPGYLADLIVLDPDAPNLRPIVDGVGILVHSGSGPNVRTSICDGHIVVENGRPTTFDLETVIAEAQGVADALWERARAAP
ncbi:MAG: amidohydrolase [Alphaproteobacteria bacterium]|nr:amidohydrolase [Alphaproteobacteria bacterium]